VLRLNWHLNPWVLAALVERYGWWRKARVREGTDGYGNYGIAAFGRVVDGRATVGTEAKRELGAFISDSNVLSCRARDLEARSVETSLLTEYATRSLLTGQAVADRNAQWLTLQLRLKLAA